MDLATLLNPQAVQVPPTPQIPMIDLTQAQPLTTEPINPQALAAAAPTPATTPMADAVGTDKGMWEKFQDWMANPHNANRLQLLSAALTAPGSAADKMQLAALSQTAYGALQKQNEWQKGQAESLNASQIALRDAQAGETRANTNRIETLTPVDLEKTQASTALTRQQTKNAETELAAAQLALDEKKKEVAAWEKVDPTRAKKIQRDIDKEQAEIDRKRGETARANAEAGKVSEETKLVKAKASAATTITDPNATKEQKEAATTVYSGGKSPTQTHKDNLENVKTLYKQANPGATDQEASQFALEHSVEAKGEKLRALTTLLNQATPGDAEHDFAKKQIMELAKKSRSGAPPTGAASAKVITEADIASNMAKYKKTREEVLAAAKAQGYTLAGEK